MTCQFIIIIIEIGIAANVYFVIRWSFGILCYEIVTLGDTPYPDVSVDELLDHLKSGKRLKKPDTCSDEL